VDQGGCDEVRGAISIPVFLVVLISSLDVCSDDGLVFAKHSVGDGGKSSIPFLRLSETQSAPLTP
jgi:hypothetical protein